MSVKEEKICRLCLKVVKSDFKIINEIIKEIFEVLMLRVNLDISKDPIICKDCTEVVEKCFNFKSVCIDTEELIFSFAIDINRTKFELKDIYKDVIDVEALDVNFICRFCTTHLSGSNFILLDTLLNDVLFAKPLQELMPDMNFDRIKNPVLCISCKQNLESYIKFVEKCSDVEEIITKYYQSEATPFSDQFKLSDIAHLNIFRLNSKHKPVVKHEEITLEDIDEAYSEVYSDDLTKTEVLDIKDEVNLSETAYESSSDIFIMTSSQNSTLTPTASSNGMCDTNNTMTHMGNIRNISEPEIFKCAMCNLQTKYKNYLKYHMMVHKDITKAKMFECTMCTFQTKHKRSLRSHMLSHKDITEVKIYKCSVCVYETKYKCVLKNHMVIHEDITEVKMYKCSICSLETKHKRSLYCHMLRHKDITEIKMHKCTMCTYKAKRKFSLKSHVLKRHQ